MPGERFRTLLAASGASLSDPLTDAEIGTVERHFGFTFSSDHRRLLGAALPLGAGWIDWRDGAEGDIRSRLDWPADSIAFDVVNNRFWPGSWGERPADDDVAVVVARGELRQVPTLVPVFSHRLVPAGPGDGPVFSVYGCDTIYYGSDVEDYLEREFVAGARDLPFARPPKHVRFWSELAENRHADL